MKIKSLLHFIFANLIFVSFAGHSQSLANFSKDSLLSALKKSQHDTNRVILLNNLAYANNYSNPVASFNFGFEAKKLADSLGFNRGSAEAFRQIGMAFWDQGNIPSSINYFLSGLRIAESNHYAQIEADITSNIGTAYNSMGNPREALTFLTRALALQRKLKNRLRESAVLNNIGDSYFMLKKFNEATRAYSTALQFSLQYDYKLGIATNLRNLGNVLEASGKYDSALRNYFKCIKLSIAIDDQRGYILSNKSIASVYLKTKKITLAHAYAQKALDAAIKSKLRAIVRDTYELLYKISEAENDERSSFVYFKLFIAYKDSVQNLKTISDVASQRLLFETEKKQTEIELLKKDAALHAEQITSRNQLIAFGGILFLVVVLWLYWGALNSTKMKTKNELLSTKNDEVTEQHRQISLHHNELVKLNEELRLQREVALTQRDSLADKNREIELMSLNIAEVNENLEKIVNLRTQTLDEQNSKLMEYAFLNAHKLRAPLARIMGLANLLQLKSSQTDHSVIMNHLIISAQELNDVVRTISGTIQRSKDTSANN